MTILFSKNGDPVPRPVELVRAGQGHQGQTTPRQPAPPRPYREESSSGCSGKFARGTSTADAMHAAKDRVSSGPGAEGSETSSTTPSWRHQWFRSEMSRQAFSVGTASTPVPQTHTPTRTLVRVRTPQELMEKYRSAFTRGDVTALTDCFSFPLLVLIATGAEASVAVADAETWPGVLQRLLDTYQRLSVVEAVPLAVSIDEPMMPVAIVRAHWALQRQNGDSVYDFTAVYTLTRIDGQLRIVAVAHNELPALQAAMRLTSR